MPLQLDVTTQFLAWLCQSDGAASLSAYVGALASQGSAHSLGLAEPGRQEAQPVGPNAHGDELTDGYALLRDVAGRDLTGPLRNAVVALVAAGLPGVFSFMLPESWTLAERVRERVSTLLATDYEILDDSWAWSIAPGRRGWPPHRGGGLRLFDRSRPELVTVWVALGDVAADQACMHVVPLDEDPGYPSALERIDAPLEAVRAVPMPEGAALAWNANLLHWGGGCASRAAGPRVSCSFSLGRADANPPIELATLDPAHLDPQRRLDMIANQIATYGEGQPDVSREILQWARANRQLRPQLLVPER